MESVVGQVPTLAQAHQPHTCAISFMPNATRSQGEIYTKEVKLKEQNVPGEMYSNRLNPTNCYCKYNIQGAVSFAR